MIIEDRHLEILRFLAQHERVTVQQLSDMFDLSTVTVRNDLNALADQGKVKRVHGGAVLRPSINPNEFTFAARRHHNAIQKAKIGQLAASTIKPMDSVLLDSSTTALAVGHALKQITSLTEVTVITTGLWTAMELMGSKHLNVVIVGGDLRGNAGSIVGPMARDFLKRLNIKRAFLGAWGISQNGAITDTNSLEIDLKQLIVELVDEITIVADGSKFGQVGLATFADVQRVSYVITDDTAPSDMLEAVRSFDVHVRVVR
jgi:DeoR/GlpR family transcriptional regulator of sugar metabolism